MFKAKASLCMLFFCAILMGCVYYKEPKGADNVAYVAIPDGQVSYWISDASKVKWEKIAGAGEMFLGFRYVVKKIDTTSYKTFSAYAFDYGVMVNTSCDSKLTYGIKLEPNARYALSLIQGCKLTLVKLDISLEELKVQQSKNIMPGNGVDVVKTKADLIRLNL